MRHGIVDQIDRHKAFPFLARTDIPLHVIDDRISSLGSVQAWALLDMGKDVCGTIIRGDEAIALVRGEL